MPFEKILFPTKFRELAFDSLESLFVLKEAGLKEIIFCHVISREEVGFVPYGGYLKKEEEKRREEARIRFEDWQKSLSERGIASKIIITVGEPVHEIITTAEHEKVDIIVVGRKKRIDIEKSFIGSYTHKIITRSKIPVLVSKYMVQFKWDDAVLTKVNDQIFEMPLIAVDWTDLSKRTVDCLLPLGSVIKKAFVFHNIAVKITKPDKSELHHLEEESKKKLEHYCGQLKSAGIDAEYHLGAGNMLDEILRISREREATMIVIGNTCKDRLHEMLHKSISYQVAKASELPTLLIP